MIGNYISNFQNKFDEDLPWLIIKNLESIILEKIKILSEDFESILLTDLKIKSPS